MAALSCFRCLGKPSAPRAIVEHNSLTMVAADSLRRLQLEGVHSYGSQSLYLRICRQQIVKWAAPPPSLFLCSGIRVSVSKLENSEEVSPCSAFLVAHERSVEANDIPGLFEGHRWSRLWSDRQSFRSGSSSARRKTTARSRDFRPNNPSRTMAGKVAFRQDIAVGSCKGLGRSCCTNPDRCCCRDFRALARRY